MGTFMFPNGVNIPGVANFGTGKVKPMEIDEIEGIERHATFVLDPGANILALERTGNAKAFCSYLGKILDSPRLEASVLIDPNEMAKFNKMTTFLKFKTKIARLTNGSIFSLNNSNFSANQILKAGEDTNLDEMTFELKAKWNKSGKYDGLTFNKISEWVRDLIKINDSEEVQLIQIEGLIFDENGKTTKSEVELIVGRLKDRVDYEIEDRNSSYFVIPRKYKGLIKMYESHRKNIHMAYRENE
jgi:hypothetical protein